MNRSEADIIVAGSGHNGLVAACYLAKAGLNVLVLEAHPTPGGMTTTNPMPGAPAHIINEGSIHASLFNTTNIDKELGLTAQFGLRSRIIDPAHVHLGPDGESLAMWRDHRKTADEMRRFSRRDAENYLELARVVDRAVDIGMPLMQTDPIHPEPRQLLRSAAGILHSGRRLPEMVRWVLSSQAQVVDHYFEHPMSRGPWTSNLPFMRFQDDLSGWAFIYLGVLSKWGVRMFQGGTGAFPAALIRCLEAHNGSIRTNAPVEQLIVTGGRVTGVRLRGGEEVMARRGVVTAFSPKNVLTRLLPPGILSDRLQSRAEHIPSRSLGIADYALNVAVKGKLSLPRHSAWRGDGLDLRLPGTTWNTHEQGLEAWDASARGEVPAMIPGISQITTAFDSAMAPPGHDTFWFWTGLTPSHPREGWDVARDQITERVIKDAAQYFEGLEELEIARRPLAKPDIEKRFWAMDGALLHVDPLITRFGPLKPALGFGGYRTPVPGLFLSGSGTHPVAGICGLPGRGAARAVIRTLKREDGRRGRLSIAREADTVAATEYPSRPT